MKWHHSIRWRIQLWHGLMLVLVLAGFGFTAWQFVRMNQLNRVDHELEQRIGIVEKPFQPRDDQPPRRSSPGAPLPAEPVPWHDAQTPPPAGSLLSPGDVRILEGGSDRPFYFALWYRNGLQAGRSAFTPSGMPLPEVIPGPPSFRSRGRFRECVHTTPGGERILVGRDIGDDLAGIRRYAWLLAGTGGAVLMLGLLGGGWLSGRALRPIEAIGSAAAKIAAGDLEQRIHTADTQSELGRLAIDLNDTFARLEASFARQAQFTADASHELRTPVTVVLTHTQSALARERPAAEYRESLEACQRAAQRMRGLIEGLLTLARLDAKKVPAALAPCALDRIARESAGLLRPLAEQKDVHLELELAPAECQGNEDQLVQVVFNLVSNAIDYSRPGGAVRVTVGSEPGTVFLAVRDTGQGIAPEELSHIFERFYRVEKSRSNSRGHCGLGLSIVKAIVEAHEGRIDVASTPGEGSNFVVRLPLASTRSTPSQI